MSGPYRHARIGADLDGLAELRAAVVRFRYDPNQPLRAEMATTDLAGSAPSGSLSGRRAPEAMPAPRVGTPAVPAPQVPASAGDAGTDGADEDEPPAGDAAMDPSVMGLVARAQAGDADAFGELYDRYLDLVYRYVYYRVSSKTLTEDLVSETFLRALRRIGSFSWQGRDFAAWLITIARNLIADHFKSAKYRLEVATDDMLANDSASGSSTEGEVLETLTNRTLLEAVKQLNSEQQECVVLRFLQGLSVTETAQAMGKTDGAIKALQYRAVRTLGRLLPREALW